jgi:hypothetical protein
MYNKFGMKSGESEIKIGQTLAYEALVVKYDDTPLFVLSNKGNLSTFDNAKCREVAEAADTKFKASSNINDYEVLALFAMRLIDTCADLVTNKEEADKIRNLNISEG